MADSLRGIFTIIAEMNAFFKGIADFGKRVGLFKWGGPVSVNSGLRETAPFRPIRIRTKKPFR